MEEYKAKECNFTNVQISENGLTVTYSDGQRSRWPETNKQIISKTQGTITYFCNTDETKSQYYLSKVGNALAQAIFKATGVRVPKRVFIILFIYLSMLFYTYKDIYF